MSEPTATIGFVAPDVAELAPLFPGYEIQGLIAVGGMGAVYCALQKSLDRVVALKILPKEFSADSEFCAGFEAEAKAMARLNHPNLIGVYDFGEVNGMLFIMMEYVPGKSLYHSSYGRAIDPKEVIRLVGGICHGLAHAHENGIIHRDIKPSNILLDTNAQPKIGDFGLARPADRKIQESEQIFGTPHYAAPEVVNSPHSVDHRADIFSVGVLLHELLTARLPADGPRPASAISRCDVRFDAIIRKAIHPLPSGRYNSATELANDLLAINQKRSGTSGATALPRRVQPRRPSRPAQKKRSGGGFVLKLLIMASLTALALYLVGPWKKPKPPVSPPAPVTTPLSLPAPAPQQTTQMTAEERELEHKLEKILSSETPKVAEPSTADPVTPTENID